MCVCVCVCVCVCGCPLLYRKVGLEGALERVVVYRKVGLEGGTGEGGGV